MKRTEKQEANIRKAADRMKVSKELELLSNIEFEIDEAFENGNFELLERKQLVKLRNEVNKMWKERMENEK